MTVSLRTATAALALGFALTVGPVPAKADDAPLVVLKATGVALKPGEKLAFASPLKLDEGQSVTLVTADGKLISLKGPFDGSPQKAADGKNGSMTDVLAPLVSRAKIETSTPGVVRAGAAAGPESDPWLLDTSKPGDVCIHQAVDYDVWRPKTNQAEAVTFQPMTASMKVTEVAFPVGSARAPLPDTLRSADGAQYKVVRPEGSTTITLHMIPDGVPLDRVTVAWLLEQHCDNQALALLKTLKN